MQQRKDLKTTLAENRATDWSRLLPPTWSVIASAAVVVALLGYWYFGGSTTSTIQYVTEKVGRGDLTVTVRATGTIESTDQVEISSELSGTIRHVDVDFNDTVKGGAGVGAPR